MATCGVFLLLSEEGKLRKKSGPNSIQPPGMNVTSAYMSNLMYHREMILCLKDRSHTWTSSMGGIYTSWLLNIQKSLSSPARTQILNLYHKQFPMRSSLSPSTTVILNV